MPGRLAHVLAVLAAVVLAAALARPGVGPEPVDHGAGPPPPPPEPADAGTGPGGRLVVHGLDPLDLGERAQAVTFALGGAGLLPEELRHVAFADGEIVWLGPPEEGERWQVGRLDLDESGGRAAVAALPAGFVPHGVEPLPGGRTGSWSVRDSDGAVRVVVADAGGVLEADVEVASDPSGRPAVGWGPEGEQAYVVHADDGRVSVVDLHAAGVDRVLHGPGSRPVGSLRPAARNDVGVTRELVVAPDGTMLYVSGWRLVTDRVAGELRPRQLPLPVMALDAASGEVRARRHPAPERLLAAGPRGRTVVLAQGWWGDGDPRAGRILEAGTLSTRVPLAGRAALTHAAYTDDGRHAWLVRHAPGRALLEVVNVGTGRVVAERRVGGEVLAISPDDGIVIARER